MGSRTLRRPFRHGEHHSDGDGLSNKGKAEFSSGTDPLNAKSLPQADPDELHSRYTDPAYQADRTALEEGLQKLRRQYRVPGHTSLRSHESFRD
ncbi:hypothetical protein [Oceaniferula spumae]|uniref:hypothetical protein n=1 Tax=Oceaniferula spumae TaxID=2979115 RepID=UPI003F4E8E69